MLKQEAMRSLPSVHRVLSHEMSERFIQTYTHELVSIEIASEIDRLRALLRNCEEVEMDDALWRQKLLPESILMRVADNLHKRFCPSLKRVLNLTGVVIHTNIGRAPLSKRAIEAVTAAASSYCNLEFDIASGKRGSRHDHVEERICRLTGAEAALVVNNNAAAVLLVLSVMAGGKAAIVSRGQLVEIGGSFRIPDVMEASGVALVEVGTTNKTKLADYERAFSDETKLVVRVHTSNYRVIGFTEDPDIGDIVSLAHQSGIPVYEDLGSGALFDFLSIGIGDEKSVRFSVDSGVDVVSFSGDKLLGGPQAGIIIGRREYVSQMKKNPLLRALRPDKMTIAALEAILLDYELGCEQDSIPVVSMITEAPQSVCERGDGIYHELLQQSSRLCPLTFTLVRDEACIGGGALPLTTLDSTSLCVEAAGYHADSLLTILRTVPKTPVIGRIVNDRVLLNLRTLARSEQNLFIESLFECANFLQKNMSS